MLQAQSALQGLLPRAGGVAADYAGAIDVLEVLQGVLDVEAAVGRGADALRCAAFRLLLLPGCAGFQKVQHP